MKHFSALYSRAYSPKDYWNLQKPPLSKEIVCEIRSKIAVNHVRIHVERGPYASRIGDIDIVALKDFNGEIPQTLQRVCCVVTARSLD